MGQIALVLVLSLLFQQVALATYACPIDLMPTQVAAPMPDCSGVAETGPSALCDKHCHPDHSTLAASLSATVPATVLPPIRFEILRALPDGYGSSTYENVAIIRSDPPPTLRFCSLLI